MAKYWATCTAGLEFTVVNELERLEGTNVVSDSLFCGGIIFQTTCSAEKLSNLRSVDNIYAFVAHFQVLLLRILPKLVCHVHLRTPLHMSKDVPLERDAAITFFKNLAVKVDWKHALDTFGVWNIDKDHDSLLEPAFAGDNSLLFRVSCHRTSTYMKRHEFTSVDAEAAIGEGIHYLFGWPASMRLYDLEVVAWIRDAEILLAIALLPNWNRKKKESLPVCCPQDGSSPVSDLVGPLFKTRKTTELGETKLRPRPSRVDSQLYARRLYRKALVGTSLKPRCGCGTIPFEAAECLGGQVMCLAGDTAQKAVAAAERNLEGLKEPCDVLHWDAARLPLRTGCVDRIICDMPYGVRCGSTHVRQWLCPKVLREMIRVLVPEIGVAVLMVQGKFMRKEVEVNQKPFLRLLNHLNIEMEGIRVEVFVVQRTSAPAPAPVYNSKSSLKRTNYKERIKKQSC